MLHNMTIDCTVENWIIGLCQIWQEERMPKLEALVPHTLLKRVKHRQQVLLSNHALFTSCLLRRVRGINRASFSSVFPFLSVPA